MFAGVFRLPSTTAAPCSPRATLACHQPLPFIIPFAHCVQYEAVASGADGTLSTKRLDGGEDLFGDGFLRNLSLMPVDKDCLE